MHVTDDELISHRMMAIDYPVSLLIEGGQNVGRLTVEASVSPTTKAVVLDAGLCNMGIYFGLYSVASLDSHRLDESSVIRFKFPRRTEAHDMERGTWRHLRYTLSYQPFTANTSCEYMPQQPHSI